MEQSQLEKQQELQKKLLIVTEKVETQLQIFEVQNIDNVIMLVGKTGSGKSTIYNFLCGAQFQVIEEEDGKTTLDLLTQSDHFQQIRGGLDSTTKTPKIYYDLQYQHSIIDYPGFNDTENKDQLEIQLLFNKIISISKIKIVYVLLNQGDQFQNKGEDLQSFINQANIDLSQLTVIINQYNKKRTNEKLVDDFQQQLMKKYNKKAGKMIVLREIDETKNIDLYFSQKCRDNLWIELIGSQVVQMMPYVLNTYQDADNYINTICKELSQGLLQKFKNIQYKQYSIQQVEQINENIMQLEEINLILQKFFENDAELLNSILMYSDIFNKDDARSIQKIYSFFLDAKDQLSSYQQMKNCILEALQNLKPCIEYLSLKKLLLQQLKQADNKTQILEQENKSFKKEKGFLQEQNKQLKDHNEQLEGQIVKLELQNKLTKEYNSNLDELNKKSNEMSKQLEVCNKKQEYQLIQLQNQLKQVENDLNLQIYERKRLEDQILFIQDSSEKQTNIFREEKNKTQEDLQKAIYDNSQVQFNLKEKDLEIQNLRKENKELNEEINQIQNLKQEAVENFQRLQIKRKKDKKKLKIFETEINEVKNKLSNKEFELSNKEHDQKKQLDQLNDFKVKQTEIEESNKKLFLENKIFQEEILKNKNEISKYTDEKRKAEINSQQLQLTADRALFLQQKIEEENQKIQQTLYLTKEENQAINQKLQQFQQQEQAFKSELQIVIDCLESHRSLQYKKPIEYHLQYKKSIVMFGDVGTGKTTLFNKFCNSEEKTRSSGGQCTRQSVLGESKYGLGFDVIDTPGLGSYDNKFESAISIVNAIQVQPQNKIILVFKFERLKLIANRIEQFIRIFANYKKLLVFAITHFDLSNDLENDKNEIIKWISKNIKIENKFILFFSKGDTNASLCHQIDMLLQDTIPERVKITNQELITHFDLRQIDNQIEFIIEVEIGDLFIKLQRFYNKESLLEECLQSAKADQLYSQSINQVKKLKKETVMKLMQKYEELNQLQLQDFKEQKFYGCFYLLSETMSSFSHIQSKLIINLIKNKNSFMSFFKICKNCGLIWFCDSQCNSIYYCGNSLQITNMNPLDDLFQSTLELILSLSGNSCIDKARIQKYIDKYYMQGKKLNIGCGLIIDSLSEEDIFQLANYFTDSLIGAEYFLDEYARDLKELNLKLDQALENEIVKRL